MARIRSDKPEAYQSETLAEISVCAERTFKGMATIADDRGRLADKPALINGELWSMRGNHGREQLEDELVEMVKVDLICRYTGCDGKRYLHLVTWDGHQKIDRPSKSRLPRCPFHQASDDYCGRHEGECVHRDPSQDPGESSRGCREDSVNSREDSSASGDSSMLDLGSRTVDRGSVPPSAGAPKPRAARPRQPRSESLNPGDVVAAYVEGAADAGLDAPAASLKARVGRQAREMLQQGKPLDRLVDAARRMGGLGWDDLARQLQRDSAAAAGVDSRASPGESTATQRARAGAEAGRRVQAMIDEGNLPA